MSGRVGGFAGAMGLSAFSISLITTFVALPDVFAMTWPLVAAVALFGYGPGALAWAPLLWKVLLALLIYSLTRTAIFFFLSMGGLAMARRMLNRTWRR